MHVVWLHLDHVVTDLVSAVAVARPLMEHIEVLADEPVWRSEEFGRAVGLDRLDDLVNDQDAWVRERSGFTWSLGAGHRSYALHVNLSIGFRKGAGSSVIVRLRHDETDREAFDRMVAVYDDLIADARADKASLYHGGNDYQEWTSGRSASVSPAYSVAQHVGWLKRMPAGQMRWDLLPTLTCSNDSAPGLDRRWIVCSRLARPTRPAPTCEVPK